MRKKERSPRYLLVYLGLLVFASCTSSQTKPMSAPKVVGGRLSDSPAYMAGLVEDGGEFAYCGGSFVTPEVVVTAAHCIEDSRKKIFVSAGIIQNHDHGSARLIPVESILIHPSYDKVKLQNDIAILRLGTYDPSQLPQAIVPISLNTAANFPDAIQGLKVTVTGWGNTSSFGKLFDEPLRSADLDVVSVRRCSFAPGYDDVGENQICAGDLDHGGIDACNGDSGGPLVAKDAAGTLQLVGIVSWGEGCALAGKPGVYTRVSAYKSWIDATLAKTAPRSAPVVSSEIRDILNAYCYDGWSRTVTQQDGSRSLKIATHYRINGDFIQTSSLAPAEDRHTGELESNLPLCWAHLGENLTLSGAILFDTSPPEARRIANSEEPSSPDTSRPRVRIMARQNEPFASWVAPAREISQLSLTCKDTPIGLQSFSPSNLDAPVSLGSKSFDIMGEEAEGLRDDDVRQVCGFDNHQVTVAERKDSQGQVKYLVQVVSPLFGAAPLTFRLAEKSPKTKVALTFQEKTDYTGKVTIKNLTEDDIHTWRLECKVPFGLIDEYGTYYAPVVRQGGGVHQFAKPSHLLGTIPAQSHLTFTYDAAVPLNRDTPLGCRMNNLPADIEFLAH